MKTNLIKSRWIIKLKSIKAQYPGRFTDGNPTGKRVWSPWGWEDLNWKQKLAILALAITITGCTWPGIDNKHPPKNNPYYGDSAVVKTLDDPPLPPGYTNGYGGVSKTVLSIPSPSGLFSLRIVPPVTVDGSGHYVFIIGVTNTTPGTNYLLQFTPGLERIWGWIDERGFAGQDGEVLTTNTIVTGARTNYFFRARQIP
jgi:hypothetical protein